MKSLVDNSKLYPEELLECEVLTYKRMSMKERLKCFDEIMQLWSQLSPPDTEYNDGEMPVKNLWKRRLKK